MPLLSLTFPSFRVLRRLINITCAAVCGLAGIMQTARAGDQIAAYGRVSPGERPIMIALPFYLGSPQVVAEVFVKEGERVTAHQKLAITQSHTLAASEVALAKAHQAAAEERLRALSAGPKSQEIAVQEAQIKSLEAEARAEKAKKRPDTTAGKNEAAAREEAADDKVTTAQRQLDAMREVRPADQAVARAEVEEAKSAVERANALLAQTEIDAPIDGQVLKILTLPGEGGADRSVLEMGDTQSMVIKAELSVADANRVKLGDRVKIKSEAWPGEMGGTVTRISPRVERSNLTALSTFANVDRQIVEATIAPESPEKLAARSGAEVTVLISVEPAAK